MIIICLVEHQGRPPLLPLAASNDTTDGESNDGGAASLMHICCLFCFLPCAFTSKDHSKYSMTLIVLEWCTLIWQTMIFVAVTLLTVFTG